MALPGLACEEGLATALGVTGVRAPGQVPAARVGGGRGQTIKRGLDVLIAGSLLLLALPLMLIILLAILAESPGPLFYGAERVGRGGRTMRMLKFRKMHRGATGLNLTAWDDQRLTRVGVILARTKLDELPQLINVLRGEMSLVGPRPEAPAFVAARRSDYDEILAVRPGITGLSQLAFANESRILSRVDPVGDYLERILPQKCALDRLYVRRGSVGMDLKVLRWTAVAILLRRPVAVNRATGSIRLRQRSRRVPAARLHSSPPRGPSVGSSAPLEQVLTESACAAQDLVTISCAEASHGPVTDAQRGELAVARLRAERQSSGG